MAKPAAALTARAVQWHMFDKDVNFLGGHAIVGGQIPLATACFATKYKQPIR